MYKPNIRTVGKKKKVLFGEMASPRGSGNEKYDNMSSCIIQELKWD